MKGFVVKKSVFAAMIALMVYFAVMVWVYIYFICPVYEFYGFYVDINARKVGEVIFCMVLVVVMGLATSRKSPFIYSVYVFFAVFFVVPGGITYCISNQIAGPFYSMISLLFALFVVSNFRLKIRPLSYPGLSPALSMLALLLMVLPIVIQHGLSINISNLLLQDVYSTRTVFNDQNSPFLSYLFPWLVKAIVPVLMVFFLIKTKRIYAAVSVGILIYLYVISGEKIVYISSFVMLFFYFIGDDYYNKVKYFVFCLVLGIAFAPLIDSFLNTHTLKGTFIMRMLFLPAQTNYLYFDFFKDFHLYFSESHFFRMFNEYPFNRPIGFIISEVYYNVDDMNLNNGFVSDGYMNLGYLGIVVNIFIIGGIFLIFDSIGVDARYLGVFFIMVFLFLSAPMLSMFITSGLWLIFCFSLTLMKNN